MYTEAISHLRGERGRDDWDPSRLAGAQVLTLGYPLANDALATGDTVRACRLLRQLVARDEWPAFGFIAAEADLARGTCGALVTGAIPPDADWVALGTQLHGGFGSYVALGVHIGLDALRELGAERRAVQVTFINGALAPCPCVADGLIIATGATPGRGSFVVLADMAAAGAFAVVRVHDPKSARTLSYVVPDALRSQLDAWNQLPATERLNAVASAPRSQLFRREEIKEHH